ncbi:erythromycin esterase family protein [Marinifilum sp. D714]|uniref:erythromycin esterase family protein n=1 Tax=Marinifilum sp. D714 TaxID=2937523 RepID=UPI0027C6E45C|nr:erythromycin esterase family protein [Marinifilum sp. D714]MDQ2180223.1 erythromycin esterase family protein [Marinifilum sp. D714]
MNKKIILLAMICLLAHHMFAQKELVKELNKNIIELKTISPEDDFDDLKGISEFVKNKKLIGLGEATHGTSEFFLYKHRMMKYLAMHEGYRLFIIEGDFSGSKAMNDYVLHGKGSIKDGLKELDYGVWYRQEFVAFIEWIKAFNVDRDLEDKIRFYGCDINSEYGVSRKLKKYLAHHDCLTDKLTQYLNMIIEQDLLKLLSEKGDNWKDEVLGELNTAFAKLKDKQSKEYDFMLHCKRELEQNFELRMDNAKNWIVLRDKFMAENIAWICEFEQNRKAVFWAHNEHVKNDKAKSVQKPVGYYLKEKFGEQYYSFGFGFNNGDIIGFNRTKRAFDSFGVPAISPKKSSDAVFALCKFENFIFDVRSAKENEKINKFIHDNLYHRAVGTIFAAEGKKRHHFRIGRLADRFDGIIFIRNTSAAKVIESW